MKAEESNPDSTLGSAHLKDCQCIQTSTVAPVSYAQSCLLAACSQHDGWTSVAGRFGNHEVTPGGDDGRVGRVGS